MSQHYQLYNPSIKVYMPDILDFINGLPNNAEVLITKQDCGVYLYCKDTKTGVFIEDSTATSDLYSEAAKKRGW